MQNAKVKTGNRREGSQLAIPGQSLKNKPQMNKDEHRSGQAESLIRVHLRSSVASFAF
jgi:hypothetical protein